MLNALISLARNEVMEFVVGVIGVCLPFIAAATIKKMAKAGGYEKVISYVMTKADNAASVISKGIRKAGDWCSERWWIPKKMKKIISDVCEKAANFVEKILKKIRNQKQLQIKIQK